MRMKSNDVTTIRKLASYIAQQLCTYIHTRKVDIKCSYYEHDIYIYIYIYIYVCVCVCVTRPARINHLSAKNC